MSIIPTYIHSFLCEHWRRSFWKGDRVSSVLKLMIRDLLFSAFGTVISSAPNVMDVLSPVVNKEKERD